MPTAHTRPLSSSGVYSRRRNEVTFTRSVLLSKAALFTVSAYIEPNAS